MFHMKRRRSKLRIACFAARRQKCAHSAAPPLKIKPASLGFDFVFAAFRRGYLFADSAKSYLLEACKGERRVERREKWISVDKNHIPPIFRIGGNARFADYAAMTCKNGQNHYILCIERLV